MRLQQRFQVLTADVFLIPISGISSGQADSAAAHGAP